MLRWTLVVGLAGTLLIAVLPGVAQELSQNGLAVLQRHRSGLARAAAPALARWIEESRRQAVAEGVRPIPAQIRARLAGFFSPDLLDRVRFRVGPMPRGLLPAAAFGYGNAIAITLEDVVVFRDAAQAETDAALWAHELQHVLQFETLGVVGFAQAYLGDWAGIEDQARTVAAEFKIWEEVRSAKRRAD